MAWRFNPLSIGALILTTITRRLMSKRSPWCFNPLSIGALILT